MQVPVYGYTISEDGLKLAYRDFSSISSNDEIPVVCLPGLTRNVRDFEPIAKRISESAKRPRRVICLDYRGRGRSEWSADPATYNIVTEARDVLAVLDQIGVQRAIFIGTSRGGLIIHILAQIACERIAAVVLNDVGPELGVEGLREIQAYLKEAAPLRDWPSAIAAVKLLHGPAFPALSDSDWQEFSRAIYTETEDGIVADCDPAIANSFAAMNLDKAIPDLWSQFDLLRPIPMLLVRGEHSKLLTMAIAAAMQDRHGNCQLLLAKGQGHAPLLQMAEVERKILDFLDQLP